MTLHVLTRGLMCSYFTSKLIKGI